MKRSLLVKVNKKRQNGNDIQEYKEEEEESKYETYGQRKNMQSVKRERKELLPLLKETKAKRLI